MKSFLKKLVILENKTGNIVNLYNTLIEGSCIEQVYLFECYKNIIKGPHYHNEPKTDRFVCISGRVLVVCRSEEDQEYKTFELCADEKQVLIVPPLNSHAIMGLEDLSVVISLPSEGYDPNKSYNQINTSFEDFDWTTHRK